MWAISRLTAIESGRTAAWHVHSMDLAHVAQPRDADVDIILTE